MDISANSPISPDGLALLLGGAVPVGWESTELVINEADATPAQQLVIDRGIEQAMFASARGLTTKDESPDACIFDMESKFALSRSLKGLGWKQWHTAVQLRSKEECAAEGVKYRKYRYPVHLWMGPNGGVILAKLKLQGKAPLE